MNKFLVFISVSALFVASNSFCTIDVCAEKKPTEDVDINDANSINTICTQTCKNHYGWNGSVWKYNDDEKCPQPPNFSCQCHGTTNAFANVAGVAKITYPI